MDADLKKLLTKGSSESVDTQLKIKQFIQNTLKVLHHIFEWYKETLLNLDILLWLFFFSFLFVVCDWAMNNVRYVQNRLKIIYFKFEVWTQEDCMKQRPTLTCDRVLTNKLQMCNSIYSTQ